MIMAMITTMTVLLMMIVFVSMIAIPTMASAMTVHESDYDLDADCEQAKQVLLI